MKQLILKTLPKAKLSKDDFEVLEVDKPKIESGEVLIRNILLSIDAANRSWMQGRTYRDAVRAGDVMPTYAIAEVVESNDPQFNQGQIVSGESNWSEFTAVKGSAIIKCSNVGSLSNLLSIYGIAGLTAYHGLTKVGHIKSGETVLISAAAGSVGILAGQIAKAMGCRVVGLAGTCLLYTSDAADE